MNKRNQIQEFFIKIRHGIESLSERPSLQDPDRERRANIIHALSAIIMITGLAVILLTPFIFNNILYGFVLTGSIILVMVIIQILLLRKRIILASYIFLYFIWTFNTCIIVLSGGFKSEYLASYIAISVMGGLILGGTSVYHFSGISILVYILTYFLGFLGLMPPAIISFNPVASIVIFSANILFAGTVLTMVLRGYEKNFKNLVKKEQSLTKINLELNQEIISRKKIESLLRQSEDRFRSAVMDSPYPTMLHSSTGEILSMNTAWEKMSGYKSAEIHQIQEWIEIAFRENASLIEAELNQILNRNQDQSEGMYQIHTRQGDKRSWYFRWARLPQLAEEQNPILTIAVDFTNLLAAETALRESEEQISMISLATNDGFWDWNLKDDTVIFDPRYYTMAGYEVNEFPHHLEEFRKRVHPDDVELVFKNADDHLQGRTDRFLVEFRFLMKDSNWIWIMGRGKIIEQDADGNPLRFVGTHTDISKRKQAENELNQYRLQLEEIVEDRTQKLEERIAEVESLNAALTNLLDDYQSANQKLSLVSESLSETNLELETFTYSISNDLQIPLQEVKKQANQIMEKFKDKLESDLVESLTAVKKNAEKIDQHISNLIRLSEIGRQSLNKTKVLPTVVVNEVLKDFSQEIKQRKIEITVEDIPAMMADKYLIGQVFHCLISNAVKFTKNKRNPRISIGHQENPESPSVICFVKDNGVGFNMKDKEKVFETFQRLHEEEDFEGVGAGLAIVKRIIDRHDGNIWAEAKEGKGATFYFDIEQGSTVQKK